MVAVDDHSALIPRQQLFPQCRKQTQWIPLMASDLTNTELVLLPAVDQPWALSGREFHPFRHRFRTDFGAFRGVWESLHSMMTGVPTWTLSKKWVDI